MAVSQNMFAPREQPMSGVRAVILGTEADAHAGPGDDDVLGGGNSPGVLGVDGLIPLDDLQRMVTKVTKDWEPPSPRTTPAIVVSGATLQQAADQLNRLNEWGEGGGRLRIDRIPPGNSTKLTVNVHANLVRRLPMWSFYPKASAAAKAEWDQMVRKLAAHETPTPGCSSGRTSSMTRQTPIMERNRVCSSAMSVWIPRSNEP
jgi:hypothetical protein